MQKYKKSLFCPVFERKKALKSKLKTKTLNT